MPNALPRVALILLTLLCGGIHAAQAQTGTQQEAPAAVSGRVTLDEGAALYGIAVALLSSDPATRFKVLARTVTEGDGRYSFSNVPPGRYQVVPLAPAYIIPDLTGGYPPGKPVMVAAGEEVEDLDFTLTRGGVITGRVTDADGKPVVQETVHLSAVDQNRAGVGPSDPYRYTTDDRGVYRIYGLPAGRYRVSVGQDRDSGNMRPGPNRYYQRTYYPGTTSEAKAKVVEVAPGGEVADVDIKLGKPAKTFAVSGRVVNAETGQPLPNLRLGYGALMQGGNRMGSMDITQSNARGEFRLDALAPGRYAVFIYPDGATDFYSDTVAFEIRDADVSGLVVKQQRGASLSGVVVIEGTNDRATLARLLPQVVLSISTAGRDIVQTPTASQIRPAPDGSFHFGGLRTGRAQIYTGWPPVKGLTLLRVEHDGAERHDGIEITENAQITGVRVVFAYGDASIRGQVNITGGALPPQSRLVVYVHRHGGSGPFIGRPATVDARGRFIVEGLPAGDYDLVVQALRPNAHPQEVKQRVTLDADSETTVTLTLDLSAWNKEVAP